MLSDRHIVRDVPAEIDFERDDLSVADGQDFGVAKAGSVSV
jgi:hypothetical protein